VKFINTTFREDRIIGSRYKGRHGDKTGAIFVSSLWTRNLSMLILPQLCLFVSICIEYRTEGLLFQCRYHKVKLQLSINFQMLHREMAHSTAIHLLSLLTFCPKGEAFTLSEALNSTEYGQDFTLSEALNSSGYVRCNFNVFLIIS
jgi:hypothetical protein